MVTKFTSLNQLSFINVPNDSNQYSNLNLNKNIECFDPSFGHSKSKSNNVKNLEIAEKSEGKKFWSKSSSTDRGSKAFNVFNEAKEKEEVGKEWRSNDSKFLKTSSSTLSLHIAAYENSIDKDDTTGLSSKGQGLKGDHQAGLELCIQDPYEFPRQQEGNDKSRATPQVQQFAASQRLYSPNQANNEYTSDFNKGYMAAVAEIMKLNPGIAFPNLLNDIPPEINTKHYAEELKNLLKSIVQNPCFVPVKPVQLISNIHQRWKERFDITKTCYCYLLLDTNILRDGVEPLTFYKFIRSIFYVGKGTRLRILDHFGETFDVLDGEREEKQKHEKIKELWNSGSGVTVAKFFELISSEEADVNEAAMISVLEPQMLKNMASIQLTNIRKGNFRADEICWQAGDMEKLGVYNLWVAFKIYEEQRCSPVQLEDFKRGKQLFFKD